MTDRGANVYEHPRIRRVTDAITRGWYLFWSDGVMIAADSKRFGRSVYQYPRFRRVTDVIGRAVHAGWRDLWFLGNIAS